MNPEEIDTLNRITVMFLDMAEFRSQRRSNIRMADWDGALMKFLSDNELPVLEGYGTISHEARKRHAEEQYALFSAQRQEREDEVAEVEYTADLEVTVKLLESKKTTVKRGGDKSSAWTHIVSRWISAHMNSTRTAVYGTVRTVV